MKLTKSGRIEDFITSGKGREVVDESVAMSDSRVWIETSGRDDAAIFSGGARVFQLQRLNVLLGYDHL